MAVYFLYLKTFGRGSGSSAVSAAAYRAGERLRDERTGRIHDHAARPGVLHREIILPSALAGAQMDWARDRSRLWNAAEAAETRRNARVAREYLVALPVELNPAQRVDLARSFSQELADRYRFAVDLALHAPRDHPQSDPRNFHAHLLATTREVGPQGLTTKTTLELSETRRQALGLGSAVGELFLVRERWAASTNEALRAAGSAARVDHRSLQAQGIDRLPRPHIPHTAFQLERQGYYSVVAERLREAHQAQAQAQAQARRELLAVPAAPAAEAPARASAPPLEELRRQAREDWLRLRQAATRAQAPRAEAQRDNPRGPDDDLGR